MRGRRAAGIGRRTAYDRRDRDQEFAEAWDDALEAATEDLELEAVRRAKDGSDGLLMFLLRARRPERYVERHQIRHSARVDLGPPGVKSTKEGSDAAHKFLELIAENGAHEERKALADVLRTRPAIRARDD